MDVIGAGEATYTDEKKSLDSHSLHSVAGEPRKNKLLSSTCVTSSPTKTTWFDGMPTTQHKEVMNVGVSSRDSVTGNLPKGVNCSDTDITALSSDNNSQHAHDDELEKLRLELAYQSRLNLELKNQLNSSGTSVHERIEKLVKEMSHEQTEKFRLMRQITDLSLHVEALNELLQQERFLVDNQGDVDTQLVSLTRELAETKQELQQAQRSVERLEKEQKMIGSIYERKFGELQAAINVERADLQKERNELQKERTSLGEQVQKLQQNEKNSGELQRQLFQKEDFITQLKTQISGLQKNLEDAEQNLESAATAARSQEQYRADEAQDLRMLNDSQEKEIVTLRKQLEEVQNEIIIRDQQIRDLISSNDTIKSDLPDDTTDKQIEIFTPENDAILTDSCTRGTQSTSSSQKVEKDEIDEAARMERLAELESKVNESATLISTLEKTVEDSAATIDKLQKTIQENNEAHEARVDGLIFTLNGLSGERDSLEKQANELRSQLADITAEKAELEKSAATNQGMLGDQSAANQIQQLHDSLQDLEKKHYKLERSLLEAKLELAAAEERKAQLQDEHNSDHSRLPREEKKSDDLHETAQRVRRQKSLDPSSDTTKEMYRTAKLLAEIDDLKNTIQKLQSQQKTGVQVYQEGHEVFETDLRKDLHKSKNLTNILNDQLKDLSCEKENESNELLQKLRDRESTIVALIEASDSHDNFLKTALSDLEHLRSQLGNREGKGIATKVCNQAENILNDSSSNKSLEEMVTDEIDKLRNELLESHGGTRSKTPQPLPEVSNEVANVSTNVATHLQLLERDKAISKLVKQSMKQDKVAAQLRLKLANASKKVEQLTKELAGAPSLAEVAQLRQEAEVFAGQVIEQDEEIESLRSSLIEYQRKISTLEEQLAATRKAASIDSNESIIRDLRAEIDEVREANQEQSDELRLLRKKEREMVEAGKELSDFRLKVDELTRDNEQLRKNIEESQSKVMEIEQKQKKELEELQSNNQKSLNNLQDELAKSQQALEDLKKSPCYLDEMELESMHSEIKNLQSSLKMKIDELDSAQATIRELDSMLAEKRAQEADAHEEEKEELLVEIENLTQLLEEAKRELKLYEQDRELIVDFKAKLERADDEREASEQSIIANYERKISLIALDKDVTIDNLRKQLFEEKETHADEVEVITEQLKKYQLEISDLNEKLDAEIKDRDTRIYALERTLTAQEQLINNMKTEMDHLQSSMETSAARRRQEIDEMQEELLSLSSANTKLEREIKVLHLELDAKDVAHKGDVEKLTQIIAKYESLNPAEHRTAADLQMEIRVKEVKDRLEKLKWRNTSLKEENENLRERLELSEMQAKENKRQGALSDELRSLLSEKDAQVRKLETELEGLVQLTEVERKKHQAELERLAALARTTTGTSIDTDSNLPPRPPVARSRSYSKDDTQSVSSGSPARPKKNSEKKSASSPLRLSFRRKNSDA